jgi:hypothetical protein
MLKRKLLVISPYKSNFGSFEAGEVIEVSEGEKEWLMGDAPDCFRDQDEKGLDAPFEDKMIGEPLEKKSVPELKEMLRERGLPVGGRKDQLIKRLGG